MFESNFNDMFSGIFRKDSQGHASIKNLDGYDYGQDDSLSGRDSPSKDEDGDNDDGDSGSEDGNKGGEVSAPGSGSDSRSAEGGHTNATGDDDDDDDENDNDNQNADGDLSMKNTTNSEDDDGSEEEEEVKEEEKEEAKPITFHTGSFANCTVKSDVSTKTSSKFTSSSPSTFIDGPDSGTVIVSCKRIKFRAPLNSFHNDDQGIITGVLSSAGGVGPSRRKSIRSTWASKHKAIFFLVAGPWEDIQQEYEDCGDLIWIDEEEVYDGERSVLTLKTYSFFAIAYAAMSKYDYSYSHIFKTDDDSYLNLDTLYKELQVDDLGYTKDRKNTHDFFGQCQLKYPKVHREEEYKWPIRNETYPEPWFPRYCQGAGFAISKKFLTCAIQQSHVANIRFMPFEDVAVGMVAERCNVVPEWPSTARVKVFRYKSEEVKKRTRTGDKRTDDLVAPAACMTDKIVQHRIIDDFDMEEHHKSVLDPAYCEVTKKKREEIIQEKREQGVEWFG